MARSIPEISTDTRLLVQRLSAMQPGETVTYNDLTKLIGRDVRKAGMLASARWMVLRDSQIVIETVRRVGVKRLDDVAIAQLGDKGLAHIRNSAKKTMRKLTCVEHFEELSPELQAKHNTTASVLGVMEAVTRSTTVKKLEKKVEGQLPLVRMLDAIRETL